MAVFSVEVPARHQLDVFVAGGGPAGVAAAVAAARQGCSVFLAEGQACFGGMGTCGLVPVFMPFGNGVDFLAGGIGREVHDAMEAYARSRPDDPIRPPAIRAEVLKRIYDDMVLSSGAKFTFHTHMIAVECEQEEVRRVICWGKSGLFAVQAAVYVDATGDGDLAAWGGAPFEKGDEQGRMMPGTLCSLWADVDWDAVNRARAEGQREESSMPAAIAEGRFTIPDRHLPGMWRCGTHVGGGNIGHTFGVDGTDERSLTDALLWGRKLVLEYESYYKECLKGFERMELVATGALLGLRETRRIMGDYVLCLADFESRAVFDDEIGRYNYPVDIHSPTPDEEAQEQARDEFVNLRYKRGESYGVPYRCLIPRGLRNVLVSGRCVSSDRYLQGSIRVMPGCFITGQAAGIAAAMAAETGTDTRGIDVAELQSRLKALGAFLPNA